MSEENVEIVRRSYENWRGEGEIRAHPDLVWDVSRLGWPGQQIYSGPEGANEFNAEWAEAWVDWELEVEDCVDFGERVVAIINSRARRRPQGCPSTCASLRCGRSATDSRSGCRCTRASTKLSKPPGCRSRPVDSVLAAA